ncbi:MAG: hypothetical protein Q8J89_15110 [Caulobacter sp.]|nr:hypothetical protein [Caulobacter sp.]
MTLFKQLIDAMTGGGVSDREIRAETWALGGRHGGEVLRGARAELAGRDVPPRRASVLRAVIRSQEQRAGR